MPAKAGIAATTDSRPARRIGGGDLPVPKVDPKNPDVVYSTSIVTWRSEDGGKTWTAFSGAPGGDDYQNIWINPNNPGHHSAGQRSGRHRQRQSGPHVEFLVQPADRAALSRVGQQHVSRTGCAADSRRAVRCASPAAATTARSLFANGIRWASSSTGTSRPIRWIADIIYGAGRGQVSKFHWSTGQVQMSRRCRSATRNTAPIAPQPILFSPLDPHVLYYAANVLFKTTRRRRHTWQTISPDLTRPHPGIPPGSGDLAAKDPAPTSSAE